MKVSKEYLHEYFRYEDGNLYATKTRPHSKVLIGDKLGYLHKSGRMRAVIFGVKYGIHQLVWIFFHGVLPEFGVDHEDRNPLNNRIKNLRECTASLNAQNRVRADGKKIGVNKSRSGNWESKIVLDGETTWLGTHDNYQAAVDVRVEAEKKMFKYSPVSEANK